MPFELLPSVIELLDGVISIQQGNPYWEDSYPAPQSDDGLGMGTLVGAMVLGIALSCLFGWWGKSRAEDSGVNPWIGFAMGFCFGFIGVMLVPVFRVDRVIVTRNPQAMQQPMQPNPMYAPGAHGYAPQQGYAPPQGYGQPPPMQQYSPPPQAHQHSIQPGYAPPAHEPAEMLVADEQGYVECPHCQSRTKSGRKACMNCGNFLPPVYDPNIK